MDALLLHVVDLSPFLRVNHRCLAHVTPRVADLGQVDIWASLVAPRIMSPQVVLCFLSCTAKIVLSTEGGGRLGNPS